MTVLMKLGYTIILISILFGCAFHKAREEGFLHKESSENNSLDKYEKKEEVFYWVNSKKSLSLGAFGESLSCFQVSEEVELSSIQKWEPLCDLIAGFVHEEGTYYRIKVLRKWLMNHEMLADRSPYDFELVEILDTMKEETNIKQGEHDISMYPEPKEGFNRYVIALDKQNDEDNYKVEVVATKRIEVDCNHHSLSGSFLDKNLSGWGYTYYEFTGDGSVLSTRMGCLDQKTHLEDVKSHASLMRYNSKMPIVVYVPEGIDVQYTFWQKEKTTTKAERK